MPSLSKAKKPARKKPVTKKAPRQPKAPTDASSLDAIFRPRSVAVVGASRRENQIGNQIVRNLVEGGFTGPVYPVNPSATVVHSMHCFPRVSAIPGPVDMAMLVVPAPFILQAAKDCGEKGVKGLVCITAGFSEIGGEGIKRQEELMKVCDKYGMRLVGPNCMGVLNTDACYSMNASFADTPPIQGKAAFLSQSGALGAAILADARSLGLGISMFASVGNRADISPPDLLQYWEHDPNTKLILMYLEAFGEPEKFLETARRVSRKKPVLVVKSGRSDRGAKAAISHTGSLAASEMAVDALLNQCGVLRVDSMSQLFDLASAVQQDVLPTGPRIAIVTNAGGPAILATDACAAFRLEMANLSKKTTKSLKRFLPPEASVVNPVDMIASADAEAFDKTLALVAKDPNVDMVLAIFVAPIMINAESVARVFAKHAKLMDKPLVTCLPGKSKGDPAIEVLHEANVSNYRFPEDAARVLAGLVRVRKLRNRPDDKAPTFRVQKKKATTVLARAKKAKRSLLTAKELHDLLIAYGIPVVPGKVVNTREEALKAARTLGFPLVAKVEAQDVSHKSDAGGVLLDIRSREELLTAYDTLEDRFAGEHKGMQVLLQSLRAGGIETFFGVATDPLFGRMIAFGLGGIHVEILKDVVFRLHPLTPTDAREMVNGLRAQQLLEGARGKPPVDKDHLIEILLRLSRLLTDHPEITELDLNPYLAGFKASDSCALDMRAVIQL
jgi:acetyl coenzyme A synthetase (ADP forming)-like protein